MPSNANVLFLCTGNSARSQMAEGLLRRFGGDRFNAYSAGTAPRSEVHPLAKQVMNEAGIDISAQRPKAVTEYLGRLPVRYLVIVCDGAYESCPRIWPGLHERLFWPFDDPAAFLGSHDEGVSEFRRVRNEIEERIHGWLAEVEV